MIEVHDEKGNLIATIHDPEEFSRLLDTFEKLLQEYSLIQPPCWQLISNLMVRVGQNVIDASVDAARMLRQFRKRLGDERDGLYPVDLPRTGQ